MKILIIGHKGMLGSALVKVLKGNELVLWDLPEVDITDERIIDQMVAENPEIVINASGYTQVDEAETHKKECKKVNIEGVKMIVEGCERINTPLFHFSSDYVFKGDAKEGYRETDKTDPINFYGKTKAESEKYIIKKTEAYFIVRTSGLYGPNGRNFVDTILEKAKAGGELTVVNDQFIKPTYTLDLAKAIREMIDIQPEYGIYHLVNEGAVNWCDFAKKIIELAKLNINLKPTSSRDYKTAAKRPANSTLLNTKLKALRNWSEALADYIKEKAV